MTNDLNQQRKSLEDSFFGQSDEGLIAELEAAITEGQDKQERIEMFGVSDANVVRRLKDLGLGNKALAAVSLVPLVQVAWADGKIQSNERNALLSAAERAGLPPGGIAYKVFKGWLSEPPAEDQIQLWKDYVKAVTNELDAEQREFMKQEFLGRAEQIAAAAGGILLRIGSVSKSEQAVLDDLASVFTDG